MCKKKKKNYDYWSPASFKNIEFEFLVNLQKWQKNLAVRNIFAVRSKIIKHGSEIQLHQSLSY